MSQTVTETSQASELEIIPLAHLRPSDNATEQSLQLQEGRKLGSVEDPGGVPPSNATGETERWNKPLGNVGRLVFASWAFAIAGLTDGAVGVRDAGSTVLR